MPRRVARKKSPLDIRADKLRVAMERELGARMAVKEIKSDLFLNLIGSMNSTRAWQEVAKDEEMKSADRELGEARIELAILRYKLGLTNAISVTVDERES
jgi:hypothetical protein